MVFVLLVMSGKMRNVYIEHQKDEHLLYKGKIYTNKEYIW